MPSRCLSTRLVRIFSTGAVSVALAATLQSPLLAQDKTSAPRDVKVTANRSGAVVSWAAVELEGVTYRVLRMEKGAKEPVDITRPTSETSVTDAEMTVGTPYTYQVMAVFKDGTTAAAEPVEFTLLSTDGQRVLTTGGRIVTPTAVNGVAVTGTVASAVVSWQPVPGATSYTVKRGMPGTAMISSFPGITSTSWTDTGPQGIGFTVPGVYPYVVEAALATGTVSGSASWTRPEPSCAAPPASQQMLAVLAPPAPTLEMAFPTGVGYSWPAPFKNSPVVAHRVDRSAQGSNAWTQVATTCDGSAKKTTTQFTTQYSFIDLTGIAPNTTYAYRLTALAANGEAGSTTVSWTSPNASTLRWLSTSVAGNTVTLKYRYEPPTSNPPSVPYSRYYLTTPYGLNQMVPAPSGGCTTLAGCSVIVNNVPSGTHVFTLTASWTDGVTTYAKIAADTTVIVP